ncbi:hypothetical protein [Flavisolibacter nicotianae]|uniref:hypothetical protein n=1 Tax=Flavisolibacter nicotianae TaxID=2364882 RepID=UPI000EB25F17|nr:hypothetical protein [Flavisolibacter nicotianae]
MKKTFLAMLLVGGTMSVFAQNTQTNPTNQSTTNPTTAPTTTQPTTTQPTSTPTDPSTTTSSMATDTVRPTGAPSATGNWNGVSASTSWTPETAPAYSWNNYGNWQNMGSVYPTGNANLNNSSNMNNTAANGALNSTGSYSAYGGTAVANLPANVQMRFNQDFPTGANNQFSWNQYGDWFHTHYLSNGRLWQYYYSKRGDGYALVLPVVHTYVPENIINNAIQKYGTNLYSIGMVKTNSGNSAYQVGLIQNGQLNMQYLDDNGATVADVWRTEDSTGMNSMQNNAAMDSSGSMNAQPSTGNETMSSSTDSNMNNSDANKEKTKVKVKHADGSIDKIKTKNGQLKVKSKPSTDNTNNEQQ